jgi:hypothetical protein
MIVMQFITLVCFLIPWKSYIYTMKTALYGLSANVPGDIQIFYLLNVSQHLTESVAQF